MIPRRKAILCVINSAFITPFEVFIYTLRRSNSLLDCDLVVMTDSKKVQRDAFVCSVSDKIIDVGGGISMPGGGVLTESIKVPYRFAKHNIFALKQYDEVFYFDVDMIVRSNIDDIIRQPKGAAISVARPLSESLFSLNSQRLNETESKSVVRRFLRSYDSGDMDDEFKESPESLKINSGVIAFSPAKMPGRFLRVLYELTSTKAYRLEQHALRDGILKSAISFRYLDPRFNFLRRGLDNGGLDLLSSCDVRLLHFNGKHPWKGKEGADPVDDLWWKEYRESRGYVERQRKTRGTPQKLQVEWDKGSMCCSIRPSSSHKSKRLWAKFERLASYFKSTGLWLGGTCRLDHPTEREPKTGFGPRVRQAHKKRDLTLYEAAIVALSHKQDIVNVVVVGANDGRINDPGYKVIYQHLRNVTDVVLVEPQASLIPYLRENYRHHPRACVVNAAIGVDDELRLYGVKPEFWDACSPEYGRKWPSYRAPTGVTSATRAWVSKWLEKHADVAGISVDAMIEEITVRCYKLVDLLDEYDKFKSIDVLQIDVEGSDDLALYACSIKDTAPKIIHLECKGLPKTRLSKLVGYLGDDYFINVVGRDLLAIRKVST